MESYHAVALHIGLDVQARGGGGVAERLHASCGNLVAVAEVERRERGEVAQCPYPTSVTPWQQVRLRDVSEVRSCSCTARSPSSVSL
jgi:hypothetical protein